MALTRKPSAPPSASILKEADIDALINRGGEVPSSKTMSTATPTKVEDPERIIPTQLRLTKGKLDEIDKQVKRSKIKISRHSWLLQAIEEKLERDA